MDKAALRRHLRALRRSIPPEVRRENDRRLGQHLAHALRVTASMSPTRPDRPVALYAPKGSEASPLLALPLPRPIAWPRVASFAPPRLTFHLADLAALSTGTLGIREPASTDPEVQPLDLFAIVVPLLGFDAAGYRLGQGGGFYDALIASLPPAPASRPRLIGLAYASQRVARLPREPHDRPVDLVLTEDGPAT